LGHQRSTTGRRRKELSNSQKKGGRLAACRDREEKKNNPKPHKVHISFQCRNKRVTRQWARKVGEAEESEQLDEIRSRKLGAVSRKM